jgi:hypothetical protein
MSKRLSQRRGSTSRLFSKNETSQFGDFPYPGLLKKTYTAEEQHSLKFINSTLLTETALDLTDKNLTVIPEEIRLLQNLEQLTLSSNKISKLPSVIGLLSNLQVFSFHIKFQVFDSF